MVAVVVGPCGQRAALSTGQVGGSSRHAQGLLLVLAQVVHVEVAVRLEPVLVHFDRERRDQPQAALNVGEDPHDVGAPLDLLVQTLEQVGRFEVFLMLARQPVEGSVSSMCSSTQEQSLG